MTRANGFTLIELMITLVLVAIVATIAVPAWSDFIRANRLAAATNEFITALNYTRSEAVRRNTSVSLCPSADQSTCVDTTDWSDGWIVFVGDDPDSPGVILRVGDDIKGDGQLSATANQVIYLGDGSAGMAPDFALQLPGCRSDERRTISLGFVGRPSAEEAACV